jgi:amino-acid N-acetyltransferase
MLASGIALSQAPDLREVKRLLAACRLPVDDIGDGQVFIVARARDQLCGTAGLELFGELALLRSVAVDPAWRGKGVAHALCDEAMERARTMNVRRLFLLTTDAQSFFSKLGFCTLDRDRLPAEIRGTAQFRELCPQTAVAMVRGL